MKKKILLIVFLLIIVCFVPKVEKCKCGGTTIKSLIYCIEKDNIDLSGAYEYSVDILGINVYKSKDGIR